MSNDPTSLTAIRALSSAATSAPNSARELLEAWRKAASAPNSARELLEAWRKAASAEGNQWWLAILRLVPKEHREPMDAVRYVKERLNAWGGLLAVAGFAQDAGAAAGHHIASDLLAHRHLRGELARHLGHPKDAPSDALLGAVQSLQRELASLHSQAKARTRALDDMPNNDVTPHVEEAQKPLRDELDALRASYRESVRLARLADRNVNADLAHEVALFREKAENAAHFERNMRVAFAEALALPAHTSWGDILRHVAKQADELTKAQRQAAAWDIQAQDLRDELTDFRNQVARALGAEPSSLTTDEMLRQVGEGAVAWRAHERLVEALHVGRPASEVEPDELVEWAKQTYAHRALVDRLTAALRRHTPFESVERLCTLLENGTIAEMIRRSDAWKRLVDTYNEGSAHGEPSYLQLRAHDAGARLELAVRQGVQLLRWMREQSKTEG